MLSVHSTTFVGMENKANSNLDKNIHCLTILLISNSPGDPSPYVINISTGKTADATSR